MYSWEELGEVIDDAMVVGIPVNSLIESILFGLATDRLLESYDSWLSRQIKDPDANLVSYCTYVATDAIDIYQFLFREILLFIISHPALLNLRGDVYSVRLRLLDDHVMQVEYVFVTSSNHLTSSGL